MRIDASGRVGIGMTANSGCLLNVNDHIRAENSAFLAGRETAALPAFAFHDDTDTGMFNVASNILAFSTAGAEAMRIDASGNVEVKGGTLSIFNPALTLQQNLFVSPSTSFAYHEYPANGLIFRDTAGAEHLRINSTGSGAVLNVGGGGFTQTNYGLLGLNGANGGSIKMGTNGTVQGEVYSNSGGLTFQTPATYPMTWYPAGALAMTLDSSGNLLLGKSVVNSQAIIGCEFQTDGEVYSTIATGFNSYHVYANGGYRFYVNANGGIHNYSANNVNLSDEREKKNIELLESQWDSLKQWSLKKFHYNADDASDNKKLGVIAQEVATHNPEVIDEFNVDDDTTRLAVKEQQMMWMAIKALQEAQTRIESLEARIAALES
jgi:hypothetical protein